MLRIALPQEYQLTILPPQNAAQYLLTPTDKKQFVIIDEFLTLEILAKAGLNFTSVNIGNTKFEETKTEYAPSVYLSQREAALARDLRYKGVQLDIRQVPASHAAKLQL